MSRSWMLSPRLLACVAVSILAAGPVAAEPTPITVHVISKDAKFIGSSMGGVLVVISDAGTGRILAEGLTSGGTGDTRHIMLTPHVRRTPLAVGGAAGFSTSIDLDQPTRIKVTATGPMAQQQAANTVSSTQWVLPGKGVDAGDAWLLEMPGLVVDVLSPPAHIKFATAPETVRLTANVTMMCGCPLAPEGVPWDSDDYQVTAHVTRNGERLADQSLGFAGTTSQFAADLAIGAEAGLYQVVVSAYDARNGNTGVDSVTFVVP